MVGEIKVTVSGEHGRCGTDVPCLGLLDLCVRLVAFCWKYLLELGEEEVA